LVRGFGNLAAKERPCIWPAQALSEHGGRTCGEFGTDHVQICFAGPWCQASHVAVQT